MTGRRRRTGPSDGSTSWLPGGRVAALRCLLAGHRWASQPTSSGTVVVLCGRCSELVAAAFVDQTDVLGLAAEEGRSWLGVTSSSRLAIDLVAAVADQDAVTWGRLRREATARPGATVDSLAQLAAVLSSLVNPRLPLRGLQVVADGVERSVVAAELEADRLAAGDVR